MSSDRGASWQPVECPAESISADIPGACFALEKAGLGLWLRNHEVSFDGGRTWQTITLSPDPAAASVPRIDTSVALADGGWLGVADVIMAPDNDHRGILARSSDGVRWETVLPDPCSGTETVYTDSSFSRPVPLGDRWLVAYTCIGLDRAQRSELYLLDPDGTHPEILAAVEQEDLSFGSPVVAGTTVVVPEIEVIADALDQRVSFLQLRP